MTEKYILEARYLDKINRCKHSTIVGVFRDLDKMEQVKTKLLQEETKYNLVFSVNPFVDLGDFVS